MGVAKGRRADELDLGIGAQDAQRRRQRHLAEAVVVAVGLAVDRDGDYALVVGERGAQALGELDPVPQKLAEGDTLRELRLTKEHVDEAPARQDAAVEAADVERFRGDRRPGCIAGAERPDAGRLVRREQHEGDAALGERGQGHPVDGHLGQPHPLGRASEAVLEVPPPPADLGAHVARGRERQERVTERGGPRVAVTGARMARDVRTPDRREDLRGVRLQPGEQRRAEVEARPLVAVDEVAEPAGRVEHTGLGVRGVALAGDACVPVAVGRRRGFGSDHSQPRMLARRLVEVAVQAERTHRWVFRRHSGVMVKRRGLTRCSQRVLNAIGQAAKKARGRLESTCETPVFTSC